MNLIIVESPTKARTLSRFLGNGYSVEATMGHIKDLPKSKLSVDVANNFEPDYAVVAKKKDVISKLKKAGAAADSIYIATDPDREGEAIAAHVVEIIRDSKKSKGEKNISRISFHEITKSAVEEAMGHPGRVNENLVNAQVARRVLDRLVGYKLSPLLWKKVRRGLSAGRVQSVAVRLIVEREREIEAFKADEYWEIYSNVRTKEQKDKGTNEFLVKLLKISDKKVEVKDGQTAEKIVSDLENSNYKVQDVRRREVRKSPYPPFTTSTMTQGAARLFGWSAKKTMSLAQKLYEEGFITYHRTDSVNLAASAVTETREYIKKTFGQNYIPENARFFKKTSKLAQEAHEAIRPTNVDVTNDKLQITNDKFEKDTEKLYSLIWKRFVACQMANSIMDETTIDVLASAKDQQSEANDYILRVGGQVMKFDGWRRVMPLSKDEGATVLPVVEKDQALDLIKVLSEQKFTQPPPRYNEASLIKALEKLGIGRPSTYAPIITTIQLRAYVEKGEGKFSPTPVGTAVTDFLTKNFPEVVDYKFTADMEGELDNIANGGLDWHKMMGDFYRPFENKLGDVEKTSERVKIEVEKLGRKCPTCETEGRTGDKQGELVIRIGRFGKFISCALFPECKHTEKFLEKIDMPCPKCKKGEVIIKYTKSKRKFFGCSRYPKCKFASWKKPTTGNDKVEVAIAAS